MFKTDGRKKTMDKRKISRTSEVGYKGDYSLRMETEVEKIGL